MFQDTSVRSTLGSKTDMRQFIADVEKDCERGVWHRKFSEINVKGSSNVKDTSLAKRHPTLNFEDQLQCQSEVDEEVTSEEEEPPQELAINATVRVPDEEYDEVSLQREPQLYLCDDWIQPMAIVRKPRELTAKDKVKANVAKNCLIVTLMSLELGYGAILERYQQEGESIAQRYEQPLSESRPLQLPGRQSEILR